jgi:hypothetical protein
MPLIFPNPCCSFDATKKRVDFWGYDNVMEVSFHMEAGALKKLCPQMGDTEAGFLKAFNTVRKQIHDAAKEIYRPGGKNTHAYVLAEKDF